MKHAIALATLAAISGTAHAGGLSDTKVEAPVIMPMITPTGTGLTYGKLRFAAGQSDSNTVSALHGAADFKFGPFGLTLEGNSLSNRSSVTSLTGKVAYDVMPGAAIFLHTTHLNGENVYGAGADYQNDSFGVGYQLNRNDDDNLHIVSGYYNITPSITAYGAMSKLDDDSIKTLGGDFDNGTFGVAASTSWNDDFDDGISALQASYQLRPYLGISAGVVTENDDMFDDGFVSISGQLDLNEQVTFELSHVEGIGNTDGSTFGFALVMETGGKRARVLDQVSNLNQKSYGTELVKGIAGSVTQIFGVVNNLK